MTENLHKLLSELSNDIKKAKGRRKYSTHFENEVRNVINKLHIITERKSDLTAFNLDLLPERLSLNWYDEKGVEYFEDEEFDPDDYDLEEFEDELYYELDDMLNECSQIILNAQFELEQFEKAPKPVTTVSSKFDIATKQKEGLISQEKVKTTSKLEKTLHKDTIGTIKIPIPFTDIKIPINRRELGIFIIGMIVGGIFTLSLLFSINFLFG